MAMCFLSPASLSIIALGATISHIGSVFFKDLGIMGVAYGLIKTF